LTVRGRRKALGILALCVLASYLGCERVDPETYRDVLDGSPLAFGLRSYMTSADARRLIPSQHWQVVENSTLPAGDRRPPFDQYTISTVFTDRGQRGELVLLFFNERLQQATFYPEAADEYLQRLSSTGAATPTENGITIGFTRVFATRDARRRFYVSWEDTRLAAQSRRWIMRYA
jgi:hypothetical protein